MVVARTTARHGDGGYGDGGKGGDGAKQSGPKMILKSLLQRQVHTHEPQRRGQALRHGLGVAGPDQ